MRDDKSLILGLWKFNEKISNKDLLEVANEWAKDPNYTQLYIRRVSKDQLGIGFAYLSDGERDTQTKYMDETSDYLKRKFGNDLVGWDVATTNELVKGFE